jgi:small-conductance mechanosensitive channel
MILLAIYSGSIGQRIGLTLVAVAGVLVLGALLRAGAGAMMRQRGGHKRRFWIEQGLHLITLAAVLIVLALAWGDELGNLGGVLGLVGAGLAVALQRVITSFAGYLIILRGKVFTVGDRITIGGVRGDVVALGFMQTTVLEMGQSPPEQAAEPAIWVRGRQYTGRVVRVTNDKIFDSPVYNYTREFPYVWDEIVIPIHHGADRHAAEEILLESARQRTRDVIEEARPCIDALQKDYYLKGEIEVQPRVYLTVTDNWLEMSLRFLSREPGVRLLKDALYRDILTGFEKAEITIASSTSEVTIAGAVEVRNESALRR